MIKFAVDKELCTQCGECAADCPASAIEMQDLPVLEREERCIGCQHCLAVCPTGALSIMGLDPEQSVLLQENLPRPEQMAALIRGRRSVRRYQKEGLPAEIIEELLNTICHAPTGVNAQGVLFTVLRDRTSTEALAEEVYQRLDLLIDSPDQEENMVMKYLGGAVKKYRETGTDILFRGAPHVLVASAPSGSPCPNQDTMIALTTFDLMAQVMGIGTLWNGFLTWTFQMLKDLPARMGIPEDHAIGYVMVFGRPDVTYARTVQRDPALVNMVDWKKDS
ncbi:MAG: nitroreductase family protein [Desulfovibrionales bacterium]